MSTHDDLIARLANLADGLEIIAGERWQTADDAALVRDAIAAITALTAQEQTHQGELICASCHAPWGSERCCRYWPGRGQP